MVEASRRHLSTNALDAACAKQTKVIGFASILTIDEDASPKGKKHHGKGKGKKRAGVAAVSIGVSVQP